MRCNNQFGPAGATWPPLIGSGLNLQVVPPIWRYGLVWHNERICRSRSYHHQNHHLHQHPHQHRDNPKCKESSKHFPMMEVVSMECQTHRKLKVRSIFSQVLSATDTTLRTPSVYFIQKQEIKLRCGYKKLVLQDNEERNHKRQVLPKQRYNILQYNTNSECGKMVVWCAELSLGN